MQHGLHICRSSCTCIYAGVAAYVDQRLHTCGGAYVCTAGAQYMQQCLKYMQQGRRASWYAAGPASMHHGLQTDMHRAACMQQGLHMCSRGCICRRGHTHAAGVALTQQGLHRCRRGCIYAAGASMSYMQQGRCCADMAVAACMQQGLHICSRGCIYAGPWAQAF